MDSGANTSEPQVRFAPRLTEDSLPVTLPKDADKSLLESVITDNLEAQLEPTDKPVSAGVLDLQLVPQVRWAA